MYNVENRPRWLICAVYCRAFHRSTLLKKACDLCVPLIHLSCHLSGTGEGVSIEFLISNLTLLCYIL